MGHYYRPRAATEVCCCVGEFYGPSILFKVILSAVKPSHTVPGQASWAVYQYLVHILSPVTNNSPSWINGSETMATENLFHDQISTKEYLLYERIGPATVCIPGGHASNTPTDMSRLTVLTQIKSDLDIHRLIFHFHLLDALVYGKTTLFRFLFFIIIAIFSEIQFFLFLHPLYLHDYHKIPKYPDTWKTAVSILKF